ncbi:MAG: hypothetical protein JXR68_14070 [Bacteroidales bacterium]|nr:hypothetical protein [Bacteroidales bacterium]
MNTYKHTLIFLLLILISLHACKSYSKEEIELNASLNSNSLFNNSIIHNSINDTIIVKSLNDCIKYYNQYKYYPDNFINSLQISEIQIPWHSLHYLDKIENNLFFIIYSYSIQNEEGCIELITCDSLGNVFNNLVISQIYSEIFFEKVDKNIYRVYGNNPDGNGISEDIKTNNSDYDFDFNATIENNNDIIIGSLKSTNTFTSLLNDYEKDKKPKLSLEESIFGEIKEKEYVKAYYENEIILLTDDFVIIKVLKVLEEGGYESSLSLNSYTLDGELISETDGIIYTNDEWSGSEIEIELDEENFFISIKETETRYKIVEGEDGTQNIEENKDYLKIQEYKFHYDNRGKIDKIK